MNLICPYCNTELSVNRESEGNKSLSLRCKYCYGIFSFLPSTQHTAFKKNRNHYEVFGLEKTADLPSIRGRYRNLALKFHPDRHKDKEFANDKMKQVNYVYSILSDSNLRQLYDATLGFDETFESVFSRYSSPAINIYQEFVTVTDSSGLSSIVKNGEYIYFAIEQYLNIFGNKIRVPFKDYMGVKIQRIFNPEHKHKYEEVLHRKLEREPLFFISFGNDEMIIYKEDFQKMWVTQKTLNARDIKTSILYGIVIIALIATGIVYLYGHYTVTLDDNGNDRIIRTNK